MAREEEYEKIEAAGFWNPKEKEEELQGEVVDILEGIYGSHYKVKQADGEEINTPAHKVLLSRLATIKKGDKIKIVFDGEEPPKVRGQNPTKMYSVYKKKA